MERKIEVIIESGEKHCEGCEMAVGAKCFIYGELLEDGGGPKRDACCVDAEEACFEQC